MPAVFEYFPFDDQPSYEAQWRDMAMHFRSSGIIADGSYLDTSGGDCAVEPGTGMQIQIAPGRAWIRGHMWKHTGDYAFLPIAGNSSGSTRNDLVVLRANFVDNTMSYQVLQGTVTPVRNPNIWDLPLATVAVPNNAISSNDFTITDQRVLSAPYGLVPSVKRTGSAQSVAGDGQFKTLNINTNIFWQTHDAMFGSDPTRIIIPQDGFYFVYARIQFSAPSNPTNPNSRRIVRILSNGRDTSAIQQIYGGPVAVDISCSGVERLLAGDYLQVQALQDSGVSVNASNITIIAHWLNAISI